MRSLLFIPADDERKLAKGEASGADALILDLEDAVSAARKSAARPLAVQYLAQARLRQRGQRLYVRVNALDTDLWEDDVASVVPSRPDGILLPKSRSGEDVHKLSIALRLAEERSGVPDGSTRILAIATEVHMVRRLAAQHPELTVFTLDPLICPCSTMFRIDAPHLAWVLERLVAGEAVNQIVVDNDTSEWARVALQRMLDIT